MRYWDINITLICCVAIYFGSMYRVGLIHGGMPWDALAPKFNMSLDIGGVMLGGRCGCHSHAKPVWGGDIDPLEGLKMQVGFSAKGLD